ncbi:MAG: selenocysteine-specific translation elongation factor [Rhodospirillaceae bacterium]|nr:selenocysteine-specific translation elongation factor [Rhodospirillaceae bacterium]|tara:strand:+ start:5070 stop:6983 length:1914 start_codon:yes stop_codon:yes gene_type:complete
MIIATSGHIDHGKSVLVKALTGVDTDRLPEEKARGISIDLGYAYHRLDQDNVLGFVDVPGHEKFVRNMLAGVTGIDYALLVIAADDGPMPQTEEHLAILDLLGISAGAVAITKTDRVDTDRVLEVIELTELLLDGTTLEGASIFPVSGITGDGVSELQAHLDTAAAAFDNTQRDGNFRLAIDRRFTVPGAGLVVTGSVFSGTVAVGDQLVLSPTGHQARVRGIHAQNQDAETGRVGQRCALNIVGSDLGKEDVHRGNWVLSEAAHAPTRRFDARIRLLRSEPRSLKHWTPVHLHIGAADISARVALLDGKTIAPGDSAIVQLVLDEPIGALHGDRLILRDQSARRTMAGGNVIDSFAPARGRSKPERQAAVAAMDTDNPIEALSNLLEVQVNGVDLRQFAISRNLTTGQAAALWPQLDMEVISNSHSDIGISRSRWNSLTDDIIKSLAEWHTERPDQPGPAENTLRLSFDPRPTIPVFSAAVGSLAAKNKVIIANRQLRLPSHQPGMNLQDKKLWSDVRQTMEEAELRPLSLHDVAEDMGIKATALTAFMRRAASTGFVIQVSKSRFLLPDAVQELAAIAEALAAEGEITAAEFRNRSGIGRNMAIEILEFFDKAGLTKRNGNSREIIKPAAEIFGG